MSGRMSRLWHSVITAPIEKVQKNLPMLSVRFLFNQFPFALAVRYGIKAGVWCVTATSLSSFVFLSWNVEVREVWFVPLTSTESGISQMV